MCYQAYSLAKSRLTSCFHSEETIAAVVKESIEQAQAQGAVQLQSGGSTSAATLDGSPSGSRKEKRPRQEDTSAVERVVHPAISAEVNDDSIQLVELLNHMQLCAITGRPCAHPNCRTGRAMLQGLLSDRLDQAHSGPLPSSARSQSHVLQPARSIGALPVFGASRLSDDSLAVAPLLREDEHLHFNEDLIKMPEDEH